MTFKYESIKKEDKERIEQTVTAEAPEPDYEAFIPAWEADHYSHSVLLKKLKAEDGDEAEIQAHRDAMTTIERAITNVRNGRPPHEADDETADDAG